MRRRPSNFNAVLVEAVEEGLNSINPSTSDVVLFYLQKDASIQLCHYIVEPEAFEKDLNKIFGFGAKVIKKKILELLFLKLEIHRKIEDNFKFAEEVKNAQKLLEPADMVVR